MHTVCSFFRSQMKRNTVAQVPGLENIKTNKMKHCFSCTMLARCDRIKVKATHLSQIRVQLIQQAVKIFIQLTQERISSESKYQELETLWKCFALERSLTD